MAMDEVFAAQSQDRFRQRFPFIEEIVLAVNTNADNRPAYTRDRVVQWSSRRPAEHLHCCSNPKCKYGNQLDLVEVCQLALASPPRAPNFKEGLLGWLRPKRAFHPVEGRFACNGSESWPDRSRTPCRNIFHVRGGVWVPDGI